MNVRDHDWLYVASQPAFAQEGRVLTKTPWAIAVEVAHHAISYGTVIEEAHYGYVGKCIKRAVFQAVRDVVSENSRPPHPTKGDHRKGGGA